MKVKSMPVKVKMYASASGFWQYKVYVDIHRNSLHGQEASNNIRVVLQT